MPHLPPPQREQYKHIKNNYLHSNVSENICGPNGQDAEFFSSQAFQFARNKKMPPVFLTDGISANTKSFFFYLQYLVVLPRSHTGFKRCGFVAILDGRYGLREMLPDQGLHHLIAPGQDIVYLPVTPKYRTVFHLSGLFI